MLPAHLLEGFRAFSRDFKPVAVGPLGRLDLFGELPGVAAPEERTEHKRHVLVGVARKAARLPQKLQQDRRPGSGQGGDKNRSIRGDAVDPVCVEGVFYVREGVLGRPRLEDDAVKETANRPVAVTKVHGW